MTLQEWMDTPGNQLVAGDIIEYTDGTKLLIGHATPEQSPSPFSTYGWTSNYTSKEIKSIDNMEDLFI